jgi:WhiB family transcriptional regulator, redox-sensing transcriptional regulator
VTGTHSTHDLTSPAPTRWQDSAACQGEDLAIFFPAKNDDDLTSYKKAERICRHCPVKATCLEDALAAGEKYGYRGGRTPKQRATINRDRNRQAS